MNKRTCPKCGARPADICAACAGLKVDPPWTPFVQGSLPEADRADAAIVCVFEGQTIWLNSRYQVTVRPGNSAGKSEDGNRVATLSIKRLDKAPIHDWRDLQRIKNELLGPEWEAVELYPAESRLVDGANQYWLWCLEGKFPLGFDEGRQVSEGSWRNSRQRPFDPDQRPADCMTPDEIEAKAQRIARGEKT